MSRLALLSGLALVLVLVPAAAGGPGPVVPGPPTGLHAFLLRADEPVAHEYSRTPSFAWRPAAERGGHYQFELASTPRFEDASIVYKDVSVPFPAETIKRQLPWMTGNAYALWARVRWVSTNGQQATHWSAPFGFNLRWSNLPQQLPAPEGLVRWSPVDGATGYEVVYPDLTPITSFQTTTNVADEREFFTFHDALGYAPIRWRVRAIRNLGLESASNGLPAVSYGPWSPIYTSTNAPQTQGTLVPTDTLSDSWDKAGRPSSAHDLTPGFAWAPSAPVETGGVTFGSSLYRLYIFSDKDCVNRIFTGSVVGSPAFAPRTIGGPMALPGTSDALGEAEVAPPYLTGAGSEGAVYDAIGGKVQATEAGGAASASGSATAGSGGATPSGAAASSASTGTSMVAGIDLWDSGWPTGRFYWTVVPVTIVPSKSSPGAAGASPTSTFTYHDAAVPQDSCQSGVGMSFGKASKPVVTSAGRPFISGVAPSGRMVAAAGKHAVVYAQPIVAWEPTVGATKYQVEVSHTLYPWHGVRRQSTPATSAVLPLSRLDAGTWFYRVRAIDDSLPAGARARSWSLPVQVRITGNQFTVVK
jgi:hypothetical protein